MASGADVAYLTDAGTPGISDPGGMLVRAAREAGHIVSPIPGPSAVTALISVSGVPSRGWLFEGFLPPKGERRVKRLAVLTERGEAFVLYESPHRIGKLFDELARVCPTWEAIIGRELTKIHEQIVAGNVASIVEMIGVGTIPARGEFVILVWPGKSR